MLVVSKVQEIFHCGTKWWSDCFTHIVMYKAVFLLSQKIFLLQYTATIQSYSTIFQVQLLEPAAG